MQNSLLRLTSYEPEGAYSVRAVTLKKTVSCGTRNDYYWAEIDPSFSPPMFGLEIEIASVLLAPRFAGDTILKSTNEEIHVYVCTTKTLPIGATPVPVDDVIILNWGLLGPIEKLG